MLDNFTGECSIVKSTYDESEEGVNDLDFKINYEKGLLYMLWAKDEFRIYDFNGRKNSDLRINAEPSF